MEDTMTREAMQDMIAKVLDNEIRAIAPDLVRVDIRMVKTY